MTVRPHIAVVLLATGLLLGAGCGGGNAVFTAETDDPYYREGQRLGRQGRDAEALSAYLKVIEKRGEQASAESHLEAGLICLNHIKDPIEAMHHFGKYLELQPNSQQAQRVRSLIETAKREFARTIPAHPLESRAADLDQTDLVRQLQRENDDLRAELAAQRTATTTQLIRSSRATIEATDSPASPPPARGVPLITPAPTHSAAENPITLTMVPPSPVSAVVAPAKSPPKGISLTPRASSGGRTHKVVTGETLFSIAKQSGVTVEALQEANRTILPSVKAKLPLGAELKIP